MVNIRSILFPCDFSEHTETILEYVVSLAQKYDSEVYLLHVVHDLSILGGFRVPESSVSTFHQKALEGAKEAMEEIVRSNLEDAPQLRRQAIVGDPAVEILRAVETEGIDLIVMGTHGRRGLEHTVFGSVAEKVVQRSPVPVLTVNPYLVKTKRKKS